MQSTSHSAVLGRRKEPHTIIIARGDAVRHFTIRPWVATLLVCCVAVIAAGYLLATTYLVLRDDLIGASVAWQARMQQAYEDRIATLRSQIDRITSRQLLDQQLMEQKVNELIERQTALTERQNVIAPIVERVNTAPTGEESERIEKKPQLGTVSPDQSGFKASQIAALWKTRTESLNKTPAEKADLAFSTITKSLRHVEDDQLKRLESLADDAYQTADKISQALASAGLVIDVDYDKANVGGPLIEIDKSQVFDTRVRELNAAFRMLDTVKDQARSLPVANPAPGRPVSSSFGVRRDPIIGTAALHSGMDFRTGTGTPIRATASGTVVSAGWSGGYGRMVEVEHGQGFTTRYAHMSEILVVPGEKIERGMIVGKTGSSGRSTGPHLHYEVRKNGTALDPLRFITAGRQIQSYL
ncbi:M23 family metallopeptidase [Tianweitania sp. BSSL-BM11]|uniref:M23 family metallopeptidase n=1 Tax=Tianweitania aestuarii TaxID=2814886 RepID=A0ABS5RU19_9HYPH|nr:M23 family metallopeptidase [Tianweitania aestuarii]